MKIVALAGGVGGAKLAHGLAQILPPENLTIIVNTGIKIDCISISLRRFIYSPISFHIIT